MNQSLPYDIKSLKKIGFEVVRHKGSHHFLQHADGRCIVVPAHAGETISRGLLAQIMLDCEIPTEDMKKIL
jgi:predicted RNA binding protein YcfA (HicA-like mRNA interferase family)